jgi:hypothetical protein
LARNNFMPQPESFAKCACQLCGGHIEFPVHAAGETVPCPHCGQPTLLLAGKAAPVEIGCGCATRRWIYAALGVVGVALLGGAAYLDLASDNSPKVAAASIRPVRPSNASPVLPAPAPAPVPPPEPEPPADLGHGLKAGAVTLEKLGDGRLIYAVGTLSNATTRQRFGVKVDLDVLDDQRHKIGSATDYADVIEPGKEWKFRAMVTDKAAASARLAGVKEQE